ncbi:MAG: hypothetical protein ACFFCV_03240 [Promethearchaeota archaeon]
MILHENIDKTKVLKLSIVFVLVILILGNLPTFNSQLDRNHKTHSNIRVASVNTEMELFLNGVAKNDGDSIQAEIDDLINVTVYYRDNITKEHIPNATVELVGWGFLNETNNQYYNIMINAADLNQGVNILTIYAQKSDYDPQSIQFLVIIVERATNLQLFLNGEDKTLDPTFSLTIGQILNITVKYTDNQTGNHITTGIIQIIGEGSTYNLTRNDILEQYSIILDTKDLGIGVKLFSIVAHANNYQIKTIELRITVSRIIAEIRTLSGVAQIEAEIGDEVLLQIVLNDKSFGGNITGAIVTYIWAYGQGELEDPDNNGIYEVLLENVREGFHIITIIAFAGEDYDFEPYELTLIVITPSSFTLISDATIPDTDGSFILMWNNSIGADNYSVYQYDKYITEINESVISLANEITNLTLPLSNYTTGTYYFIIIAYNKGRNTLSNCIEINVSLPLPGYFMLWSNADIPDTDGLFILMWNSSNGAVYYSVYQYDRYITEINGSLTPLTEEITNLSIFLNNYLSGTYYFIVVAHGDYGDTLSNCILVSVLRIKNVPQISGYNLFFVIVMLSVILLIGFKKKIK